MTSLPDSGNFSIKAQKIPGEVQGNVLFDAIVVFACFAYLLYMVFP